MAAATVAKQQATKETSAHKPSRRYPYLDGLRGIAILTVTIGHSRIVDLFPAQLRIPFAILGNGHLGVRIFFVISGFLITSLLLNELEDTGTISIPGFYKRRIARIFPAFYAYVGFIAALMLLGLLPAGWPYVLSAATFTWNYGHFWWANVALSTPWLANIWTLSLEEQFYVVWPATVKKLKPEKALRVIIPIILILPFVRVGTYFAFPNSRGQVNMMFHTAIDTILTGAAAAIWRWQGLPSFLKKIVASPWTGPVCLFFLAFTDVATDPIRGAPVFFSPSVDCMSTAVLILWLLDGPKNWIGRALEFKPLMWVGLVSYSLYLWQPIIMLKNPLSVPPPFNIVVSFLVAAASYYLLEQPARSALRRRWGT